MLNAARFLIIAASLFLAGLLDAGASIPKTRVGNFLTPAPVVASAESSQVLDTPLENWSLYDDPASGSTLWTMFDPEGLAVLTDDPNKKEQPESPSGDTWAPVSFGIQTPTYTAPEGSASEAEMLNTPQYQEGAKLQNQYYRDQAQKYGTTAEKLTASLEDAGDQMGAIAKEFVATAPLMMLGEAGPLLRMAGFLRSAVPLSREMIAAETTSSVMNGKAVAYTLEEGGQGMQTLRDLRAYYQANHGGTPSLVTMDKTGALGGEFDTITGNIKLNMNTPLQYRAGFRAEEYLHFQQLHTRGWLGRELTGSEIDMLENEAFETLSNSGFKPVH